MKVTEKTFVRSEVISASIALIEATQVDQRQAIDELTKVLVDPKSNDAQKVAATLKFQDVQTKLFVSMAGAQKNLRKLLNNLSASDFNPIAQANFVKSLADADGKFTRAVNLANGNIKRRIAASKKTEMEDEK